MRLETPSRIVGVGRGRRSLPAKLGPIFVAVALGVLAGLGGYTFNYAQGLSYFSHDPRACVNCHIMQREYDSWQKSGHHHVAVCIDCHLPEPVVAKYLVKAENGWRHGKLFTTGGFTEPIEVKAAARSVLQENCVRCHGELTSQLRAATKSAHAAPEGLPCMHCHADAGHGERAGLGGPLTVSEKGAEGAKR